MKQIEALMHLSLRLSFL